jgi:hypothetical protein
MYKIKPSVLDSYRIYKYEIFEKSLDDILKTIKGEYEPSSEMNLGSEIHKFFETGEADLMPEEIAQLQVFDATIPKGINELKFQQEIDGILFSVVIDRIRGNEVIEFKTGSSFHGVEFYNDSVQWKIYLLCSECDKATYYNITYNKVRPYQFKLHYPFSFYRYKTMQDEIIQLSHEFIEFCKLHDVENYILV